jgi:hypothetical protein
VIGRFQFRQADAENVSGICEAHRFLSENGGTPIAAEPARLVL